MFGPVMTAIRFFPLSKPDVIGDKHIVGDHLLHHRMADRSGYQSCPSGCNDARTDSSDSARPPEPSDANTSSLCHMRGAVVWIRPHFLQSARAAHGKQHVFQDCTSLSSAPRIISSSSLSFRRDIALCIGQGLLAGIVVRHQISLKEFVTSKIVAEYFIELDL